LLDAITFRTVTGRGNTGRERISALIRSIAIVCSLIAISAQARAQDYDPKNRNFETLLNDPEFKRLTTAR
jgi:hypothetical protein